MLCNTSADFPFTNDYIYSLSIHRPETGQGLYQDPNTIEHHKAPTGDLYAMPEKSNKRRAPPQPEMATYQDPNTIQRQQAHTGDLYALPDKKPVYSQVNKDLI